MCIVLSWFLLVPVLSGEVWTEENPRDIIEAYRVWKLTEALDLSEDQMPVFFARLRKVEERSADFKLEQRKALGKIAQLLDKKEADEDDLARALARYEELKREHREEAARLRSEAVSLLNVRQRCQHAVFEERFRSELREMISRVREMRAEERGRFGEPRVPGGFGERNGGGRPGGSGKRGR
jgi:benzoyl-CoA reductase/2-hydroxyglutaryl-CoA dehydratase subunit BcrC/BadD/HgdB